MKELRISELDLRPQSWHADLRRYLQWYSSVPTIIVGILAVLFLFFYINASVQLGSSVTYALIPGIIAFGAIIGFASYLVKKIDAGKSKTVRENLAYASHWQTAAAPAPCEVTIYFDARSPFVKITPRDSKSLYFRILSVGGSLYLGSILESGVKTIGNVAVRRDPLGMFAYFDIGQKRYWCLNHFPNGDLQTAHEKTMINQSYSLDYYIEKIAARS